MRNRFGRVMLLACCGALAMGRGAYGQKLSIGCCELLDKLAKHTIHSSGDQIPTANCKQKEDKCLTLNLIKLFLKQKNAFLQNGNSGDAVEISNKTIVLNHDTIINNALDLLVFSFLGLSVATQQGLFDEHLSLEYDSIMDKLTVRDSACAVNKTVYSTIVMASIALIVFFIVMQIIEEQKTKEQNTEDARENADGGLSINNAKTMGMPCGPNLQNLLRMRPLQYHTGRALA
jgi:hypothetical protein